MNDANTPSLQLVKRLRSAATRHKNYGTIITAALLCEAADALERQPAASGAERVGDDVRCPKCGQEANGGGGGTSSPLIRSCPAGHEWPRTYPPQGISGDSRAEFEKWCIHEFKVDADDRILDRDPFGYYEATYPHELWSAWQAARQSTATPAAAEQEGGQSAEEIAGQLYSMDASMMSPDEWLPIARIIHASDYRLTKATPPAGDDTVRVPRIPTLEMIDAAVRHMTTAPWASYPSPVAVWNCMIAAAPKETTAPAEDDTELSQAAGLQWLRKWGRVVEPGASLAGGGIGFYNSSNRPVVLMWDDAAIPKEPE